MQPVVCVCVCVGGWVGGWVGRWVDVFELCTVLQCLVLSGNISKRWKVDTK